MEIVEQSVELLWITNEPEYQIELAGRTCYKSEDKMSEDSAKAFSRRIRDHGHHAILEHAAASFRIITDRGISHEIVRHRVASYAQESTRYCNYSSGKFNKQCTFIEPPDLTPQQREIWERSCLDAEKNYFELLDNGCSAQMARSVLPNCLKTEIVMMANFREWRHFIDLRGTKAAHPQVRPIAKKIWEILMEHGSSIFEDLKPI